MLFRSAQTGSVRYTYHARDLSTGRYDIRVTNLSADNTDARYMDDLYLTAIREVLYDDFEYPTSALLAIRGLATEALSGSFRVECKTSGRLVRVWRDDAWHTEVSQSPAAVGRDILTMPVFDNDGTPVMYRGFDPAEINQPHWNELADYNADLVPNGKGGTEPRLTWNGQFDSQQTMWDAALAVLSGGRATPYWRGNMICLSIDKPVDQAAAVWSVGNVLKSSFKEFWLKMSARANRVEVDYLNVDNNLDRDKLTVVNHAAPAHWGVAKLPLQGCIYPSEVIRRCRYHLNTTLYTTRTATLACDVDRKSVV